MAADEHAANLAAAGVPVRWHRGHVPGQASPATTMAAWIPPPSSAWLRARPGSCTSASSAPSSSTGCSRASTRRRVPAADREHRHLPRGRGGDRADPGLAALARDRLGRRRSPSSSTGWRVRQELARRLVDEGKAYEDEGAIRFRMPDEGETGWDDVVRGRIEFPNEQLEDVVHRPLRRPPDLQLRLAGRGHARRDHARDPRRRPRLEHAEADPDPARARPRAAVLRARPGRARPGREEALEAARRRSRSTSSARDGYVAPGADELPRAARLERRRQRPRSSRATSWSSRFSLERVAPSPATFDYDKLDWLNGVYLRAMAPRSTRTRSSPTCASRATTGRRSASARPRRSCRRRSRGSASSRSSPASSSSAATAPTRGPRPRACSRPRREALARSSRSRAEPIEQALRGARRAARAVAAEGVPADPRRRHRLAGLAGPVREPRAARQGRVARADQRGARTVRPRRARAGRAPAGTRATRGAGTAGSPASGVHPMRRSSSRAPGGACAVCHFKG